MGGFLIVKRGMGAEVEEIERVYRSSIDVFNEKGLSLNKKVVTPEHIIYVFNKYRTINNNIVQFDNGDFIAVTGTMFYKGISGGSALNELFNDFSVENQSYLNNLLGNYCLIISKGNRLFVANSPSGIYRSFHDQANNVISSSFLAVYKSLKKKELNMQEFYEYIFEGCYHNDNTLIQNISLIDTESILQLCPEISLIPKSIKYKGLDENNSFDEMVQQYSNELIKYFTMIKDNFGNNVCAGLSSGSDTRLMLALMRHVGIESYLYVYGMKDEPDVKIAKIITEGEGLDLDIDEKLDYPIISKDDYPDFLKKQLYLLDGLGYRGIFENGSTLTSRFKRIEHGHLQLNGAGDIAMLYYSWPNKPITISRMLQGKYDRGDYSMCYPEHFDKKAYFSTFKEKVGRILNTSDDKITRNQLEMLLPLLRIKYWTGMNHMINNQLSDALVPFCEPRFFHMTSDIPFKQKYLGYFKAALINFIDPTLAKYPSGYGFRFSDYTRIPAKVKLKNFFRYHTPAAIRPFLRAHYWKQETKGKFPYYLSEEYQNAIFRSPELSVSEFIDTKKISDSDMLSRVLTCEILLNDNF